jgi:multisubunit Na+/H+ antiporter MnhG subunit
MTAVRSADTRNVTLGSVLCLCAVHMCCCVWEHRALLTYVDTHIETSAALNFICIAVSIPIFVNTDRQTDRQTKREKKRPGGELPKFGAMKVTRHAR